MESPRAARLPKTAFHTRASAHSMCRTNLWSITTLDIRIAHIETTKRKFIRGKRSFSCFHLFGIIASQIVWPARTTIHELEQPDDFAFGSDVDLVCGGDLRKAGHGHDVATNSDDEFGAGGESDFTDRHHVMFGRAFEVRISTETVLRFCDANGELSVTLLLELAEAITDFLVADDIVRSIHLACDRLRLFPQRQFIQIKRLELRWCRLDRLHNGVC